MLVESFCVDYTVTYSSRAFIRLGFQDAYEVSIAHYPCVRFSACRVTPAGCGFQSPAVVDGDIPAAITDQAAVLQRGCGLGDTGAADAEYMGEEIVRHIK